MSRERLHIDKEGEFRVQGFRGLGFEGLGLWGFRGLGVKGFRGNSRLRVQEKADESKPSHTHGARGDFSSSCQGTSSLAEGSYLSAQALNIEKPPQAQP